MKLNEAIKILKQHNYIITEANGSRIVVKDIKLASCDADVETCADEGSINIEFFLEGSDVTSEFVERLIDKIDNFYDCNGLNDIMNDSYNDGNEMVWKVDLFFNTEDVDDVNRLVDDVKHYIKVQIKNEKINALLNK